MKAAEQDNNLLPPFSSENWQPWTPRSETAPKFERMQVHSDTFLAMSSVDAFHAYGAWCCEMSGVPEDSSYEIIAEYETKQVDYEAVSVNMIVTWRDKEGKWLRREYVDAHEVGENGLTRLKKRLDPPFGIWSVKIELEFRWSKGGTVCFRHASFCPVEAAESRKVKIVTTFINPYHDNRSDLAANLQEILETIELAGQQQPDLVCFSETLYNRSSGYKVEEVAEPLNGEMVRAVCQKTREIGSYVVFNLYERAELCIYNTSILIGRDGEIAGIYRKNHLTTVEGQAGVTPGSGYPVFETDFGTIGMLVCWDQNFTESARCLRMKGAEIICISTAGEAKMQQIARALDNGMYVVVAGINGDMINDGLGNWVSDLKGKPSRIINPIGEVLGEIGPDDDKALGVEIDLNAKFTGYWLSVGPTFGEMRSLYTRQRRPDTYSDIVI